MVWEKPSTFCHATYHWSPPSQSVTLPETWQFPGHSGAFHITACPLFQAVVLLDPALKKINKYKFSLYSTIKISFAVPRARLQPDSPTTNALSPGSSFSRVRQIADACRTSRTNQNKPDEFSHQRTESGFATPKVSVPAMTQPVHLYPQLPGGPVSCKLYSQKSKTREALQRLTSYSPTPFFFYQNSPFYLPVVGWEAGATWQVTHFNNYTEMQW